MWFSLFGFQPFMVRYVGFQLETLLKLFPVAGYRNLTLQCLSEVSVVTLHLKIFFSSFLLALALFLELDVMIVLAHTVLGNHGLRKPRIVQVAVLNCGDYYDAQFVKLYTIFMVQLQVQIFG